MQVLLPHAVEILLALLHLAVLPTGVLLLLPMLLRRLLAGDEANARGLLTGYATLFNTNTLLAESLAMTCCARGVWVPADQIWIGSPSLLGGGRCLRRLQSLCIGTQGHRRVGRPSHCVRQVPPQPYTRSLITLCRQSSADLLVGHVYCWVPLLSVFTQ